jgi:hypothetical protein
MCQVRMWISLLIVTDLERIVRSTNKFEQLKTQMVGSADDSR